MNDAALIAVHRSKDKCGSGCSYLTRRVMRHCAEFSLACGAIVVGVADDPLAPWQTAPDCLVEDLLQRVKQLTALIQQEAVVWSVDGYETALFDLARRRVQTETRFEVAGALWR